MEPQQQSQNAQQTLAVKIRSGIGRGRRLEPIARQLLRSVDEPSLCIDRSQDLLEPASTQLQAVEAGLLRFSPALEQRFEEDTREARSHGLWLDGAVTILVMNFALLFDCLFVHDHRWLDIVRETALITPVAVAVNLLMRYNPPRWIREGSIAFAMTVICAMNMFVEGNAKISSSFFGIIGLLVTALFVGIVMRLRFPYLCSSLAAMSVIAGWSLSHAAGLLHAEVVMGCSLIVLALGLILLAGRSLELSERRNYLAQLIGDLQTQALTKANEELQRLSVLDKLTALPNRRALEERLAEMWEQCTRTNERVSVVMLDVDHFKKINDSFGHFSGDQTLRSIGSVLLHTLRNQCDLAGRFGGEEFLILLPGTAPEDAVEVAERIRKTVEAATPRSRSTDDTCDPWQVTVSCGVSCCYPGEGVASDDLLRVADVALYRAKENGRNRVEFQECDFGDSSLLCALP